MRKLILVIAVLFAGAGAFAQGVTTATINGVITDSKGESLPGANVVAIHQPTGTQYGTSSRADGRYTIPNARVGGPYQLTVSFVGYENQVKEGIFLSLGSTADVNFKLAESGTTLEAINVTASKDDVFNSDRTGASTNISNQSITRLPTISRSFGDYVRLTPQANGNSFGGRSDGYNNITVDGALFNNAFGLSGTVGGQANAQPISLDAIDQITTTIAPYDVKEGSFTGAGVNMVTRSGTNDVSGSVYYFTRNQNLAGSKVSGVENKLNNFDFNNVGFRVGGAIIKNKLFFFANYERERRNDPGTLFTASRNGSSGTTVSQVQASDLDALKTFLINTYGYDPGPYEGYKLQSNSDKGTIKLDYNISTNHKFTVKYNYLKSYRDVPPSNSGSLGGTRNPSQTGMPFLGSYYRINNNLNSVIAELNSTFGSNYSNKFQVGYTAFRDFRETPTAGKLFPLVDIGNGSGQFLTAFGYEPFSAFNILNSNVFQLSDNFDLYKGKHTLTFGTYNEFYHFENGFDPFYYGAYQFNSLADFYSSAAGTVGAVRQYQLGYSTASDGSFPLVKIDARQLGFYAQDKFDVSQNFNVTYGIRVDIPTIGATIKRNDQAATYTFAEGRTIYTDHVQKSQLLWSPRVGFNWDVKGDRSTQVRGGSGIFTGRVPYVWISNQASNNGQLFGSQFYNTAGATTAGITFQPDVDYYRPGKNGNPPVTNGPATYNLAVTDDNFKFPQIWRTNIAVDQKLPGGLIGSLDFVFTRDLNAVYHQNINLPDPAGTAAGADNRPIYYKTFPNNNGSNPTANTRLNATVTDAILMRNTNKPYSYFITGQLKKTFGFGLDAMLGYTYTDARSVNDGGSIAQSIWRDRAVSGNPNENVLSYSNFLKKHRIIASANYRKEYAGFMATSVGFFYELSQAGRFSYVYAGDMNGDNAGG
ncbi:MAG: TonB-dependent receptor, partial [Cyclobacteriaceae bacterium]|nr:TonB-dependent receptor [Cyclobacteriaceae bacterium]